MGNAWSGKNKTCKNDGCNEPLVFDENLSLTTQKSIQYCPSHTCVVDGCFESTLKGSEHWFQYCFIHKCSVEDCPNYAKMSVLCENCV